MVLPFLWGGIQTPYAALTNAELASLVNGSLSALTATALDNSTNKYLLGYASVQLGSAAFVTGGLINLYIVPPIDLTGSTYPTFTSAAAAGLANYFAGSLYVNGSTAAQKENIPNILIPPGKFKCCALTFGFPTLAASGNQIDLYPTTIAY